MRGRKCCRAVVTVDHGRRFLEGMGVSACVLAHASAWLEGTAAGQQLAQASVALAQGFASLLSGVYTSFGAKVADVLTAFQTTAPFTQTVTLGGFGTIPLAVAMICTYTWECTAPPVGPNIHANSLGYGIIANAFLTTYLG